MIDDTQPVRIKNPVVDRIRKLADQVKAHGWQAIGVIRSDRVTLSSIVEEALNSLENRNGQSTDSD